MLENTLEKNEEKPMRNRLMTAVCTLCLLFVLSPASAGAGRHPEIEAALRSLAHAREHLERAAHDFGGHRVDAIRAIDEAERQLQICLQY